MRENLNRIAALTLITLSLLLSGCQSFGWAPVESSNHPVIAAAYLGVALIYDSPDKDKMQASRYQSCAGMEKEKRLKCERNVESMAKAFSKAQN